MNPPTPLRRSRVLAQLKTQCFATDLKILGVVSSTSDIVIRLGREGARDGTVRAADGQSQGRGRRGNLWQSPSRRGIYVSILVRPAPVGRERLLLPARVAVAVARAIDSVGLTAAIKWPNDLLVLGKKIGGCLIDLVDDAHGQSFAVIGIGLNANFRSEDLVQSGALPGGSISELCGRPVDRERLLAALLDHCANVLRNDELSDVLAEFRSRDALLGATVCAQEGDKRFEGVVVEADPEHGLLLRFKDGAERRLRPEHTHLKAVTLRDPAGAGGP